MERYLAQGLLRIVLDREARCPDKPAYRFLVDGEEEGDRLTYRELASGSRAVAARIEEQTALGDRVLLLLPPGLQFIRAFVGCLLAGRVAVPAYPPRSRRTLPRLLAIFRDARPALALTDLATGRRLDALASATPELRQLPWLAVEEVQAQEGNRWHPPATPPDLAFLQYTSGSTATPKGVRVRGRDLLANEEMIRRAFGQSGESVVVGWLPLYHDMGLIGNVLQPLYVGGEAILMSPAAFLQRPRRWLAAISGYRATTSGGPNFAYDLCVEKISPDERQGLDLSSWQVAFNGAEPVRAETLERFAAAFGPCGFSPAAFYPCYGLAEATLLVTAASPGQGPRVATVAAEALERDRVVAAGEGAPGGSGGRVRRLVACGRPQPETEVVVADPATGEDLGEERVGEIWVRGPSVADGYWERPEETSASFGARLAGMTETEGGTPFLRTGDLGFLRQGELFITGRRKEMMVIRGRNLYPQDIEQAAEGSHSALRPGGAAAFSVEVGGVEGLVVVCELEARARAEVEEVLAAVRQAVGEEHEVTPHEVVLVRFGTVPKTTSGKTQRLLCRKLYRADELPVVARTKPPEGAGEEAPEEPEIPLPERRELVAWGAEEGGRFLTRWLRGQAARVLRLAQARLPPDRPLIALGLDSLAAASLRREVGEQLGVEPAWEDLLSGASLEGTAEALWRRLAAGEEGRAGWERSPLAGEPAEGVEGQASRGQQALWLAQGWAPDSAAYHLRAALRVTLEAVEPGEAVQPALLAEALARLSERHGALRTTFPSRDGEPRALAHRRLLPVIECRNAAGLPEAELRRGLAREAARAFDLGKGPLLRLGIWRWQPSSGPAEVWFLLTVHHIVADFWSLALIAEELARLYQSLSRGETPSLPPLSRTYGDQVRAQEALLAGPRGAELWRFWRDRLAGEAGAPGPPPLELPVDRPYPPVPSFRGGTRSWSLPRPASDALEALAAGLGCTAFVPLLAAFFLCLHRTTGQEDLLLGTPMAGRTAPGLEGLVGYFVNPVVIRCRVRPSTPFAALVKTLRREVLAAFAHQDLPFPLLVERLTRPVDLRRPPLMQALFVLETTGRAGGRELLPLAVGQEGAEVPLGGLPCRTLALPESWAQFELSMTLARLPGGFVGSLLYATDLFDATTVERLGRHLKELLVGALEGPEKPVVELPLLTPGEGQQVRREWAAGDAAGPGDSAETLPAAFQRQARETPERVALVGQGEGPEGGRLTFGELARRVRHRARALVELGVGPEVRVGVALDRSPRLVEALLAVLEAGGAYVPLDPSYPEARLTWMAADCGAAVVLVEDGREANAAAWGGEARVLPWSSLEPAGENSGAETGRQAQPGYLAYLIYTSGSTGRPKGVAIEHRSAAALLAWSREVFPAADLAGVLAATSVSFDLAVFELFVPLGRGGTVILAPHALALPELPAAPAVTLVNTVPSAMAELVQHPLPRGLRVVNLAGEALHRPLAEAVLRSRLPGQEGSRRRLYNLYGPSEDTTYSTAARIEPGPGEPAIGRPLPGTRAFVLDRRLGPLPAGGVGELFLTGVGLARGYLGRPALTAESFLPDPTSGLAGSGEAGERLYRTGDRVRQGPDGELHYLGRRDDQVKVRGFRVELGEIESTLGALPAVAEAAVVALGGEGSAPGGAHSLVAFVRPAAAGGPPSGEILRRHLAARLPGYMVPGSFVSLATLPTSASGKVDRRALAQLALAAGQPAAGEAALTPPHGPTEEAVAEIWKELLGVRTLGRESDFFALGAQSLLAARLVARVRERLRVELPLAQIFAAPTLAGLARRIDAASREVAVPPPPPIPRTGSGKGPEAGEYPPSFGQERLWFLDRLLQPGAVGAAVYNMPGALRLEGALKVPLLAAALARVVERHQVLRSRFLAPGEGGELRARVMPAVPALLPVVDLAGLGSGVGERVGENLSLQQARHPFNLATGPLFRFRLLRLGAARHDLLVVLHHIVADGWSLGLLLREVAGCYRGEAPAPRQLQYGDYARWQRRWLAAGDEAEGEGTAELGRQLRTWRQLLDPLPPRLDLPLDHPRPALQSFAGDTLQRHLEPALRHRIEAAARAWGATPFMVLLAAWGALLCRLSGQRRLAVGTPVAGRRRPELEGLVGLLVNLLVLPLDLSGAPAFRELVGRARARSLQAFNHPDLPFERLVEELAPERDLATSPLVQTLLVLQEPLPAPAWPGLGCTARELPTGTAKLDLSCIVSPLPEEAGGEGSSPGGGWTLALEYASDLFDRTTARRWLEALVRLLEAGLAGPGVPVEDCSLLTAPEAHQLVSEWNEMGWPEPGHGLAAGGSLFRAAAEAAARTPERAALVAAAEHWSYQALAERACGLAAALAAAGVGPEKRVGICLERGPDLVVALLGALGAGGAYVALDPAYPGKRLRQMAADAGLAAVVSTPELVRQLDLCSLLEGVPLLSPQPATGGPRDPVSLAGWARPPEALAYVLYTSGSTGEPKGVTLSQGGVLALVEWSREVFDEGALRGFLASTSVSFDLSVFELFVPLLRGGTVVLVRDILALLDSPQPLGASRLRLINTVPSAMEEVVLRGSLDGAETVNLAGEALGRDLVQALYRAGVHQVLNLYGPSEDTTYSTWARIPPEEGRSPAIGRPLRGGRARVLDSRLRPALRGVVGEICLGGAGLARGYLGRPGLTAERFVPDPLAGPETGWAGTRLYRSGDLGRYRSDGELEFLGRRDQQVKVRGFRIELGEIEVALRALSGVREAAVVAAGAGSLVAFLHTAGAVEEELRWGLEERLPSYMVPGRMVVVGEGGLPRLANGKVDRLELARRAHGLAPEAGPGRPPSTLVERTLAELWEELLGVSGPGLASDFFLLGGHSLLAARLAARLGDRLGVEVPVAAVFEAPTLGALARRVEAAGAGDGALPSPPPVQGAGEALKSYRPAFAQERLWFLDRLLGASPEGRAAYNIAGAVALAGPLEPPRLARALARVVERHGVLRSRFEAATEGVEGLLTRVVEGMPAPLLQIDLSGLPPAPGERQARCLGRREAGTGFDLAAGPLCRFRLLRLAPERHELLVTLHHSVADGASLGVLLQEVASLYRGGEPPALELSYGDYAEWQRRWLQEGGELQRQLRAWSRILTPLPPALDLPLDHPRPGVRNLAGTTVRRSLGPRLRAQVEATARALRATPNMFLLAAWGSLLGRLSGQESFAVGTPVAGRRRPELEGLIGLFVNTLVLPLDLAGKPSFREVLGRVRARSLEAFSLPDLPFERLVEELAPERDLSGSPLFQVMFVFQEPLPPVPLPGLSLAAREVETGTARFDLLLAVSPGGSRGEPAGWEASLQAPTSLFDPTTPRRWLGHLEVLLEGALAAPEAPLEALPLLAPAELHQLCLEWNDSGREESPTSLHTLLAAQAERTSEAIAVVQGIACLSYRELNRRARRLARQLRALGVGPEVPVAVALERSAERMVALLAVFAAGGAYVPLDPDYPEDRLAFMLTDSGAPVVLLPALPPPTWVGEGVWALAAEPAQGRAGAGAERGGAGEGGALAGPDNLAYILYTSGSTGRPKGAMNAHRAVVNRLLWMRDAYALGPGDRVLQKTPMSFDVSVWELFLPLLIGARLVLARPDGHRDPAYLARAIARHRITTVHFVPSMLRELVHAPGAGEAAPPLRRIIASGEALPRDLVDDVHRRLPGVELHNLYGPTEAAVDVTAWPCKPGATAPGVPIGRPIRGVLLRVLDSAFRCVPPGVPGGLAIGGVAPARGYRSRPGLSAESFVPDPLAELPGGRLYRTGDVARYRLDGTLEFLGRRDHQVKLRGLRIELGEVEAALRAHQGIEAAVVVALPAPSGGGDLFLVAYTVPSGEPAPGEEELRTFLAGRLPEFMVPSFFLSLQALPHTPSGKVDRRALPEPAWGAALRGGVIPVAPRAPLEELVAGAWGRVLGLGSPAPEGWGVRDDFFRLGGHSLLAVRLVSHLEELLGVEVPLQALFAAPTVEGLAAFLEARSQGREAPAPDAPLARVPRTEAMPLSPAQERLWFLHRLDPASPAYHIPLAVEIAGPLRAVDLDRALGQVIQRQAALRTAVFELEGRPRQRPLEAPAAGPLLPWVDLSGLPEVRRLGHGKELARRLARRPFDLPRGVLFHRALLALDREHHLFLASLHHIGADGWSLGVLLRDLAAFYAGPSGSERAGERAEGLPPLPVEYLDVAVHQRRWLEGEGAQAELAYWGRQLAGAGEETLELPLDHPRPAEARGRGGTLRRLLPAGEREALEGLARSCGATLFMVLVAGWGALLHRHGGQSSLTIGVPSANRDRREVEGLVGLFVNTLVLRLDLSPEPSAGAGVELTFATLLTRVRRVALEAYEHRRLPFERLVQELAPRRDLSRSPLFQTLLALQNAPLELHLPGLELRSLPVASGGSQVDLSLSVMPEEEGLGASFEYDADLFETTTIERLGSHLRLLLRDAARTPARPLSRLACLSPGEEAQLRVEWNDSGRRFHPAGGLTPDVLGEIARRSAGAPDAVAVEAEGGQLTFRELDRRSRSLARRIEDRLQLRGSWGPESRVLVAAERGADLPVILLAVLRAGAAYVPVDPEWPAERWRQVAADSGARLLVTDRASARRQPGPGAGPAVAIPQMVVEEALDGRGEPGEPRADPAVAPESPAYVLYTSGSTGTPKGVLISRRAFAAYVAAARESYAVHPGDRVLQFASLTFDASVEEVFPTLAAGARLVLWRERLQGSAAGFLARCCRQAITILGLPTAFWHELVAAREEQGAEALALPRQLRLVIIAGEQAQVHRLRAWRRQNAPLARPPRLTNTYGPTEATVVVTGAWDDPRQPAERVVIGRPWPGCRVRLLGPRGEMVGVGVPGQLFLGGPQLARGYLRRPALTAAAFLPDPWAGRGPGEELPGARCYASGDRARWLPGGELEFLGRIDRQVKIRGQRVEPGEVEATLAACPLLREAALVARRDSRGEVSLVAHAVAAAPADPPSAAELREFLARRLPAYMLPSLFCFAPALPRTTSGKLDREALARQRVPSPETADPEAPGRPRSPLEEGLALLWRQVLDLPPETPVGPTTSFFDLGGHSLAAIRLVASMHRAFGVELPLRQVLATPDLATLAAAVGAAAGSGGGGEGGHEVPPLAPAPPAAARSLAPAQERLWFLDRLQPGQALYNLPGAFRLRGELRPELLSAALAEITRRHEVLRTTFSAVDGRPIPVVHRRLAPAWRRLDLSALGPEAARTSPQLLAREARQPFDLTRGPLLRVLLLRLGAGEHHLLLNLHHIAADGWSLGVLMRELSALYGGLLRGVAAELPELPVQYGDYALWQRRWLGVDGESGGNAGAVAAAQLAWWRQRLADLPEPVTLPPDRPRPARPSLRGAICALRLGAREVSALDALARNAGATRYMALLAGLQALLARHSGQGDVAVGGVLAHRSRPELEDLIGFFVNTVVHRSRLGAGGDPPFEAWLRQVRDGVLGAIAHPDVPFEQVVEELRPQRRAGRAPFFDWMFVVQPEPLPSSVLPGLTLELLPLGSATAKFDATLVAEPVVAAGGAGGEGLELSVEYAVDLYDATTLRRFLAHYRSLLAAAAAHPQTTLSRLPLLGPGERHQLTLEWGGDGVVAPGSAPLGWTPIHLRVAEQGRERPAAIALVAGDEHLSYRELLRRSLALARRLARAGVGPEGVVGVALERSARAVLALLGVAQAGAAYLPLDPAWPRERLALLLRQGGLLGDGRRGVVLTRRRWLARLPEAVAWVLDEGEEVGGDPPAQVSLPGAEADPEQLLYVLFTSGSTGVPKAVAVPHHGVARLVGDPGSAAVDLGYLEVGPGETFLQLAPLAFDASTLEIWAPLVHGARLVVAPAGALSLAELARLVAERRVSTLWLTAGLFHQMAEAHPRELAGVRQLLAGGDVLQPAAVERVLDTPSPWPRRGRRRLVNGYGPTENTTFTSCEVLWAGAGSLSGRGTGCPIPIGRPIRGTSVRLLSPFLEQVPAGVPGELVTGGQGLARGYLGLPGATAEAFIPHPLAWAPGDRLYRTGDRARYLPDGRIEFLGRADRQVKMRGFRVEPGEVEACLAAQRGVEAAAVVVCGEGEERRLVAFAVAAGEEVPLDPRELRKALGGELPTFLVPDAVHLLPALPLTPNGKVDRRALARRAAVGAGSPPEAPASEPAATPVEEDLARLWAELLGPGSGPVGRDDSFFDLGGHSLLATRLIARIADHFAVALPLQTLFEAPTVRQLAAAVEQALGAASPPLPPVLPAPAAEGSYPLSFGQQRLWFLEQLDPGAAAYNIPVAVAMEGAPEAGRRAADLLAAAFGEIVARHAVLRTRFPVREGVPRQEIAPAAGALAFPVVDLRGLPADLRRRESRRLAGALGSRPFDLAAGPPFRTCLIRRGRGQNLLAAAFHHIAFDGTSLNVLVRELAALLPALAANEPSPLPPLPVQYADYAVWQRGWLDQGLLDGEREHGRRRLAGLPVLELPGDRPRPAVQRFRGGIVAARLPGARVRPLLEQARRSRATPFMAFQTLFQALLARLSGQVDFAVGTPVSGRRATALEGLIGFFVNTLVLRADLAGRPTFAALLERVRQGTLEALARQDLPFERLVAALVTERSLNHNPLFQVLFLHHDEAPVGSELGAGELGEGLGGAVSGVRIAVEAVPSTTAQFDLTLALTPVKEGLEVLWEYDRDLFDRTTVRRLQGHLEALLEAVLGKGGGCPVAELSLLTPEEAHQLLREWGAGLGSGAISPLDGDLEDPIQAFLRQAREVPERVALVAGDETLTYRALAGRSLSLALHLRAAGVGPEGRVGVCLPRGPELVVALLGVLAAAGAYVALDPAYPLARLEAIAATAGLRALLSRRDVSPAATLPTLAGCPLIEVESWDQGSSEPGSGDPARGTTPLPAFPAESLAYVLFTSGSTGQPKGVAIPRRACRAFLAWAGEAFSPGELAGVLAATSVNFDLSVFEIFVPLSRGGTVVLVRDALALAELPGRSRARLVNTVPSAMEELLRVGLPTSVCTVNLAGEALQAPLVEGLAARSRARRLLNLYGPSEDTTYSTAAVIALPAPGQSPRAPVPRRLSIGRPIRGTSVRVLAPDLCPVPAGAVGELCLAGAGLARGYLGQPQATAEAFVPDPWGQLPGGRLYLTGDRVRYRGDGELEFLGRKDLQVKLRGFRIELGEVEASLLALAEIREAAVVVRRAGAEASLVAFVVPSPEMEGPASEGAETLEKTLRARLGERLPAYMVPSRIAVAEGGLPRLPNGKVDRRELAGRVESLEEVAASTDGGGPPRNALEEVLSEVWCEVLELREVGVHASFFDLGGHSLLATRAVFLLRETLGVEVPVRTLFEHPSVASLAEALRRDPLLGAQAERAAALLMAVARLSDEEAAALLEADSPALRQVLSREEGS